MLLPGCLTPLLRWLMSFSGSLMPLPGCLMPLPGCLMPLPGCLTSCFSLHMVGSLVWICVWTCVLGPRLLTGLETLLESPQFISSNPPSLQGAVEPREFSGASHFISWVDGAEMEVEVLPRGVGSFLGVFWFFCSGLLRILAVER